MSIIFGANTDVGKTLCSVGLVVAGLRRSGRAAYLKPLQTGVTGKEEGDAALVRHHALRQSGTLARCETLHAWPEPISPHLAAARSGGEVPSDDALRASVGEWLERATADGGDSFVETAGGVLSPTAGGRGRASWGSLSLEWLSG